MTLFYKPFELLGDGLRSLSLSSDVGNIAAIIIYCLLSLIPAVVYVILKNKKRIIEMDRFLFVLSGVLFFVIYYLINPTLFMADRFGSMTLIGLFYALLVGYLVLRVIAVWTKSDMIELQKGIRFLVCMLMLSLTIGILMECFEELPASIQALKESNTMASDPWMAFENNLPNLTFTIVFLFIRCLVKIVPCILEILILGMILKLIKELGKDIYSEAVASQLGKIGNMCRNMVLTTVVLNMCFAVLQVIFRNMLYQINMDVTIPLVSIILVLAVMMVSKYMRESQKMKEELDMFGGVEIK